MGAYGVLGDLGYTAPAAKLRHLAHGPRTLVAGYPSLYLPFARATHPGGKAKILSDDTEIVIDGFTRSASTFAVFAFQLAQPRPVRVGHHTHAPAHLIAAARRGVPALVPVREPEPTILSQVVRDAHVTMLQALKSYIRFYTRLLPHRERFLVATFDEVTGDFGSVVHRLNETFGTDFAPFEHTDANVRRCFELIEDRSRKPPWAKALSDFQSGIIGVADLERAMALHRNEAVSAPLSEKWVARPSEARRALKAAARADWDRPELADLRSRAAAAYEAFVFDTVGPPQVWGGELERVRR